jgi:hypothetical protein
VLDIMRIEIEFHDQGSESRAVPYGYNGAVFCYGTGDKAIEDYAALTKSVLLTHSSGTLTLPPETKGKTLSGALMWQNGKGEKGPWSEIRSMIIP